MSPMPLNLQNPTKTKKNPPYIFPSALVGRHPVKCNVMGAYYNWWCKFKIGRFFLAFVLGFWGLFGAGFGLFGQFVDEDIQTSVVLPKCGGCPAAELGNQRISKMFET